MLANGKAHPQPDGLLMIIDQERIIAKIDPTPHAEWATPSQVQCGLDCIQNQFCINLKLISTSYSLSFWIDRKSSGDSN
jgi:hypothetical protein